MSRRILLLVLAALPGAAGTTAQVPGEVADTARTAERCRGPEHRQFDFWIGTWEVRSGDGTLQGHNEIRSVAGGCGLLERWRGAAAGRPCSRGSTLHPPSETSMVTAGMEHSGELVITPVHA
jgi:hypothetical protein